MANFPRIKWLNIDGQQVPFTEPQHFTGNGDETVRTGHDNPLPVANYTQNDSGIWMPVSKSNPVPTQVTGSIVELVEIRNVEIPANESLELLAPSEKRLFAKEIRITFRFNANINYMLRMSFRRAKDSPFNVGKSIEKEGSAIRDSFILGDVFGGYYGIDLFNRSDTNITLEYCQVLGVT